VKKFSIIIIFSLWGCTYLPPQNKPVEVLPQFQTKTPSFCSQIGTVQKPILEVVKSQKLSGGKQQIEVHKRGGVYYSVDEHEKMLYNLKTQQYYIDDLVGKIERHNILLRREK
jgi:hypothetical protein